VFVGGLATDYCVLNTVLDALERGFRACLLVDAVRAVNIQPKDGERAMDRMLVKGARLFRLEELTTTRLSNEGLFGCTPRTAHC